ncbi:hypothetical protein C357_16456 [Citreicella sp. 357]|nr:hypothetical protein C357_16456 [Citreicella sp. 357]
MTFVLFRLRTAYLRNHNARMATIPFTDALAIRSRDRWPVRAA